MVLLFDEREEQIRLRCRKPSSESIVSDNTSLSTELENAYPVGVSYIPLNDYAITIQHNHLFQGYREDIYKWLLNTSITLNCPRCVVYRASNYIDRFLSVVNVSVNALEGISWLCFYLAESMGDFRNESFSYKKICEYFYEEYHMSQRDVKTLMQYVLRVLGFRLLCPCPYTMCYRDLEQSGQLPLCNSAFKLMDCICQNYGSIAIDEHTKKVAVLYVLSCLEYGDDSLVSEMDQMSLSNYQGVSLCVQMIKDCHPELTVKLSSFLISLESL